MNRMLYLVIGTALVLSACLPLIIPTPAPPVDLQSTAQSYARQTLQSRATPSLLPSNTSVIASSTALASGTPEISLETENPILLTLTATLGTGTVTASIPLATMTSIAPAPMFTPSATRSALVMSIASDTPHPQFYGTLPPYVPFGKITLVNKAKADAYISLQVTTPDGNNTILEYPVNNKVITNAPAGKYLYVAWVGGRKMVGNFRLDKDEDLTITLYKNKVTIGH